MRTWHACDRWQPPVHVLPRTYAQQVAALAQRLREPQPHRGAAHIRQIRRRVAGDDRRAAAGCCGEVRREPLGLAGQRRGPHWLGGAAIRARERDTHGAARAAAARRQQPPRQASCTSSVAGAPPAGAAAQHVRQRSQQRWRGGGTVLVRSFADLVPRTPAGPGAGRNAL